MLSGKNVTGRILFMNLMDNLTNPAIERAGAVQTGGRRKKLKHAHIVSALATSMPVAPTTEPAGALQAGEHETPSATAVAERAGGRYTKRYTKLRHVAIVLAFIAPVLVPLLLFWIFPTFSAGYISLTDWDYMTPAYSMTGSANYTKLLTSSEFAQALKNTLVFCFSSAVLTVGGGLALASLLRRAFAGNGFFKALFFSPWVTPTVAVSLVWMWIFDPQSGAANAVLKFLHLPALQWIGSSQTAMLAVVIVTVWKSVGYAMIFYINALDRVPKTLYEAASLDCASPWKKFTKITLPCISPTTFFLCIISVINGIQAYDQIQILTQGGPSGSTRTLLYLYYQLGFEQFNMGQASALAVVLLIMTVALSCAQNLIAKRFVHY
jgi:multiple sugar transport system permease protein